MSGSRITGGSGKPPRIPAEVIQAVLREYANRVDGYPRYLDLARKYSIGVATVQHIVNREIRTKVPIPEDVKWYYRGLPENLVDSELPGRGLGSLPTEPMG